MPQRSMLPGGLMDHSALDYVRKAVCIEILHESDKEPAVRSFIRKATGFLAALSVLCLPITPAAATQAVPDAAVPAPICRTIHGVRQQPGAVVLPVQDYEPAPALWKLADEDTTIYIFGTFHILPEGFRWRTALLDKLIAETDEVVFESVEEPRANDAAPSAEEVAFAALFEQFRSEVPLSQRIAERNRTKLQRMLDLAGVTLADVERAPALVTLFAISLASSEAEGSQRSLGVETVIEQEYRANGRPVSAIEDPVAVMGKLFTIDETQMVALLDQALDEWNGCGLVQAGRTDWSSEHGWAKGQLGEEELAEMMEDPFSRALYDILLVDRNRAWSDWLAERMTRPGNVLLAVGAGHMAGPDSVLTMIEARGLKAERIQ